MPRATVQTEAIRKELQNLPGGFVVLRQLSFYDMLVRRDNAMEVSMDDRSMSRMHFANAWVRQFEFSKCIVDHNLEDDNGNQLNFADPETLKRLDPRIASEIERYIDELNQDLTDAALEDFTPPSASSLADENDRQNGASAETQ